LKVVLFCGGFGMRFKDYPEPVPKPMGIIGNRPILWHLMKYYAHFGHKDFILCLGFKAEVIKTYFLHYNEALSNDFVLSEGGKKIELLNSDTDDWRITFVDTGINASVGDRLKAVEPHVRGEEMFLANYSDQLTDLPLPDYISDFEARDAIASFLCVRPGQSFHVVDTGPGGNVTGIEPVSDSEVWVNGGFFVLRKEIFDYIETGEELVEEPFARLIDENKLHAHKYRGFWMPMDTFKELETLEAMYASGDAPWRLGETAEISPARLAPVEPIPPLDPIEAIPPEPIPPLDVVDESSRRAEG
jgi:glucose-1-phosphate cytidylyltransferase